MSRARGTVAPDRPACGPDEVRLGRIAGAFGIRGEVRLQLYNESSDLFDDGFTVDLVAPDGGRRRVRIHARPGPRDRVLGRVDGVADRDAAEALVGSELVTSRGALPAPAEGEYYHVQLLGLEVRTRSGQVLGRIAEIHGGPGLDVWVVRDGAAETWLPARRDVILAVDLAAGVVEVADEPRPAG